MDVTIEKIDGKPVDANTAAAAIAAKAAITPVEIDAPAGPEQPPLDADTLNPAEFPIRVIPNIELQRKETYQAVIRRAVLNEIHRHGASRTDVEVCGVLVGNVYCDGKGPYLYIDACIHGDAAEGHATQVTFKANTWQHIHEVMDRDYPDRKIVGWYHTHPGFGIFLSGMDLFIQDNFFNLPWQIAWVYDPVGGDEGAFLWRNGKSQREPFLVDEKMTREEARAGEWDWKPSDNGSARYNGAVGKRLASRIHDLEPRSPWVIAMVVFIATFMLTGLLLVLLYTRGQ
jgi:proteasome lid subunit RPN8/RPN11